jgi:hypothetical protein
MVRIQIELSEDENKIVEMYKLAFGLDKKSDAVKHMILKNKGKIKIVFRER